jgi:hypothetical protein
MVGDINTLIWREEFEVCGSRRGRVWIWAEKFEV